MDSFSNLVSNSAASMTGRCTCCHVCHTSLKTSRRRFAPCTTCPTIICQQCIEFTGDDWDSIVVSPTWSCPRCRGDCPCKRCKNKVSGGNLRNSEESFPRLVTIEKPRRKPKRKRTTSRSPIARPAKARRMDMDMLAVPSTVASEEPGSMELRRIERLRRKNEQCVEYISRTENLLNLIKSEQLSICEQIEALTKTVNEKKSAASGDGGLKPPSMSVPHTPETRALPDSQIVPSSQPDAQLEDMDQESFPSQPQLIAV